jgi:CPA2 family monovalent cation:H+ antiporter-2
MATDRHVVICGFGRSGQHLAKMLEQEGIGYVALDVDPDLVREAAAAGESVVYGDAARRETLVAAGIRRAAALVITYPDLASVLKLMHHAHQLRTNLAVIIRTQDDHDLDKLMQAGATEVVPEVFEGSLMLGSHALALLGVPMTRVVRRVREARDQRIGDLDLAVIGADVTAVRRRGIRGAEPSPDMVLYAGDVLVLRGLTEALELAEERLLQR